MPPTYGNGKICYVEMPAKDVAQSAEFYRTVFNWNIRTRGDGATSFDDGVGQVSGAWSVKRAPSTNPTMIVYIMVDDAAATLKSIASHGGKVVQPIGADAPEITALFADPAGNVLGLYQEPA